MKKRVSLVVVGSLILAQGRSTTADPPRSSAKKAGGAIAERYAETADRIIKAAMESDDAWLEMQELCDDIGHRLSGSAALDRAVEWAVARLEKAGQENVHTEAVQVDKWVRGAESLVMIAPRRMALAMLGLGRSVGTPPEGITASVVVVRNEEELDALGDGAKGKIVLFNNPMPPYDPDKGAGYGRTVRFRGKGPRIAAEKGAVACLVRSVTAHSLRSPHTGATGYRDEKVKIPAAAVSTEDAGLIARLCARGKDVKVTLKMEARNEGKVPSANVVAELRGSTLPDEIVVIGGHLDSWDVGQGAHDDGGGCVAAMEAVNILRRLGLRPRRTIRVVLFTNEENGLRGGRQYAEDHADELANHVAAIESDSGVFQPLGFGLGCKDESRQKTGVAQLGDMIRLLAPIEATRFHGGGGAPDIGPMRSGGVILMGLEVEGSRYFDYHHTHADTLDKVDPVELSRCVAAMAVISYVIADMPERLGGAITGPGEPRVSG